MLLLPRSCNQKHHHHNMSSCGSTIHVIELLSTLAIHFLPQHTSISYCTSYVVVLQSFSSCIYISLKDQWSFESSSQNIGRATLTVVVHTDHHQQLNLWVIYDHEHRKISLAMKLCYTWWFGYAVNLTRKKNFPVNNFQLTTYMITFTETSPHESARQIRAWENQANWCPRVLIIIQYHQSCTNIPGNPESSPSACLSVCLSATAQQGGRPVTD